MTTATIVCADGISADDRAQMSDIAVLVDGLCGSLDTVAVDDDVDRIVLVVHGDQVGASEFQASLRAAGFDPLGVPVLDARQFERDPVRLRVAIAGATARAGAFPGSLPAHAKPVFPDRFTRRSLFTVPRPSYVGAPAIDHATCAAGDGCQLCVAACPQDAYTWIEGRIVYDKDVCEPCGVCVTTCPTGAVSNPAATPHALAAQIEAMTAASTEPLGIMFRCRRAEAERVPSGWQVVEVPCTGMVTAPWAVVPLLLGAARVAVVPCTDSGCNRGLDARAEAVVGFASELLEAMGIASDRIATKPTAVVMPPLPGIPINDPFGALAAADIYSGLRTASGSGVVAIAGAEARLGVVTIDPRTCTMCTMCAQRCPTNALGAGYDEAGALTITFDPAACVACDQCVEVCPEVERGAIAVDHRVDFEVLVAGRLELNRSATHLCERCGQPVAPTAMIDRLSVILGDDAALMDHLTRLCLACRGAS